MHVIPESTPIEYPENASGFGCPPSEPSYPSDMTPQSLEEIAESNLDRGLSHLPTRSLLPERISCYFVVVSAKLILNEFRTRQKVLNSSKIICDRMPNDNSRRHLLKRIGTGGVGVSTIALAGCTGDENENGNENGNGNGGESTKMTLAGNFLPAQQETDGTFPGGHSLFKERTEDNSDGQLTVELVGESQICGICSDRVQSQVVQAATTSIGNTTGDWPANDIWALPFTFPDHASLMHTLTKAETWEKFWVPFARTYGAVPLYWYGPALRAVMIGTDAKSNNPDTRYTVPADIEGLSIRRTPSAASGIALSEWGADPVDVSWGDTLQGLTTGVVDGLETWNAAAVQFGMAESIGEIILNDWMEGAECPWVNVEFLKSLSEENRQALAEASKSVTEDLSQVNEEVRYERVGYEDPPADGSALDEEGVEITVPDDDQMEEWRDPVWPEDNHGLYEDIYDAVESDIGIDGIEFWEYLRDTAREDSVPDSTNDFTVDSHWADWIDEI